jgi:hypothetical protein
MRCVDAQRGVPRHPNRLVFVYPFRHGATVAPPQRRDRRRGSDRLSRRSPCFNQELLSPGEPDYFSYCFVRTQ